MTDMSRVKAEHLLGKIMSAEDAAGLISPGENVGMSGFAGAGYPKAVPAALVRRVADANERGERFTVSVWTGAATAPELDGALAAVDGIEMRRVRLPWRDIRRLSGMRCRRSAFDGSGVVPG
ncbi:MAG: hypothetical protein L0H79_20120 [Intrasporangium sp.]|uniref:hypothetical protein n=1 Tax=Intrasporangium sp. TaxID=1925024 RepID=UPI002649F3DC|nr:hypothetical protein [Intrasporangium sp.]MDN5798031.1 hypothetical protein [Intrasporangium sp.]